MRTGELITASTFAIARGRRAGYRVLMAPEFLVQMRRTGLLADLASAGHPDGKVVHADPVTVQGRRFSLSYASRTVTDADLDEPALQRLGSPPLDAFGRPLRIIYGLVRDGDAGGAVAPADLDRAEQDAIAAFRAFVADESGYRLRASPSPGMSTAGGQRTPGAPGGPRNRNPVLVALGTLVAVAVAVSVYAGTSGGHPPASGDPQGPGRPTSASPAPYSKPERLLLDRVSAQVTGCRSAAPGERVAGADATLRCTVRDRRPDSPVTVAGFAAPDRLQDFLDEEGRKAAKAPHGKDPFARAEPWKKDESKDKGGVMGHLITYHDGAGKAWVSWSFEKDRFMDDHGKSWVVRASGSKADALYDWFRTQSARWSAAGSGPARDAHAGVRHSAPATAAGPSAHSSLTATSPPAPHGSAPRRSPPAGPGRRWAGCPGRGGRPWPGGWRRRRCCRP
jgi:hypothetical protein